MTRLILTAALVLMPWPVKAGGWPEPLPVDTLIRHQPPESVSVVQLIYDTTFIPDTVFVKVPPVVVTEHKTRWWLLPVGIGIGLLGGYLIWGNQKTNINARCGP